jgi:dienelactone hydrolase
MRFANKWLVLSVIGLLPAAACTPNNSDSIDEGGSATLLFEVEAARIENHVFPSDEYLDRSFVNLTGATLLASQTIRNSTGVPTIAGTTDGGFTATQEANANFLNLYGSAAQTNFSATTAIRIPFSNRDLDRLNPQTVNTTSSIRIFEIGIPRYTPTTAGLDVAPPSFVLDNGTTPVAATNLVPVALGQRNFNTNTNALILRARTPFRTSLTAVDPLGRRTFAVVVIDDGSLRTVRNGPVLPSRQYDAIRRSDITGLSAAEQAAVTRHLADTANGFTLVRDRLRTDLNNPTFDRGNTLAYFEFTIRDASLSVSLLRQIMNGNVNVNRTAIGGGASVPIMLNETDGIRTAPTNGFDGTLGNADDPVILNGSATISAAFQNAPATAIATAVIGTLGTPNFIASNFVATTPVDPTGTAALAFNRTMLGSAAIAVGTANVANTFNLQLAGAAAPFSTTNLIRQFPVINGNGVFGSNAPGLAIPDTSALFNQFISNTSNVPYLLFVPATPQPTAGYPVAIVQHGFTRSKEDIIAIANNLCASGVAVVGVDVYQHGTRQTIDGNNSMKLDEVLGTQGLLDPFLNPSFLARTRDKFRQTLCDQFALTRALASTAVEFNPASAALNFDPAKLYYVGISLGGILGTPLVAVEPSISRAVLNVPGGDLSAVASQSGEIAPTLDGLIVATGNAINLAGTAIPLSKHSAIRNTFDIFVSHMVSEADPATFATRLIAPQTATLPQLSNLRGAAPPAVLAQFALNDTVVPNSSNAFLARGIGVGNSLFAQVSVTNTVIPDPSNPTMNTLTLQLPVLFDLGLPSGSGSPTTPFVGSGATIFGALHGSLFDPSFSLVLTTAEQVQGITFLIAPSSVIQ